MILSAQKSINRLDLIQSRILINLTQISRSLLGSIFTQKTKNHVYSQYTDSSFLESNRDQSEKRLG